LDRETLAAFTWRGFSSLRGRVCCQSHAAFRQPDYVSFMFQNAFKACDVTLFPVIFFYWSRFSRQARRTAMSKALCFV
jgi:hypothetical protein